MFCHFVFFSHPGLMAAVKMTVAEPVIEAVELEAAAAGEDVSDADPTAHASRLVVA